MAKQVRLYNISDIQLSIFESQPPKLGVAVSGQATTTGWKNIELVPLEKALSPDGILDLDFVGEPPEGISIPVITPVSAHFVWADDVDRLVGVKIYSRNGEVIRMLRRESFREAANLATTLAVGEEGGPITTFATGEEGGPFSTMRVGEEQGPTTMALGEEQFPTSYRRGEEGWPTWATGEGGKPVFGETSPRVDDPKNPFGEDVDWFDPNDINPFGRR